MTAHRLLVGIAVRPGAGRDLARWVSDAEQIGLSFVLFDDGPGLAPLETAAFAAAGTRATAVIVTAPATHAEPFHLSNQFSSLDWGTHGRAGWLASVDVTAARARAYSATAPDPDRARREATAVVETARKLWDSWEDGALLADSATGRFLDREKIHYVDAREEFISVRGPALMPRPVQGQVVVLTRFHDRIGTPDVALVSGVSEAGRAREAGIGRVFTEILPSPGLLTSLRRLAGHVDGVVVRADHPAAVLEELGRWVVPALVDEGVLVPRRPGQTLREQLGLPRPVSRYASRKGPA